MAKVLVENHGGAWIGCCTQQEWFGFKLQFENDSSSLSGVCWSSVKFHLLCLNLSTIKSFATTANSIRTETPREWRGFCARNTWSWNEDQRRNRSQATHLSHQLQDQDQYHNCHWYAICIVWRPVFASIYAWRSGDYDYENLPIYVCTLCSWRGHARVRAKLEVWWRPRKRRGFCAQKSQPGRGTYI